MEISFFEKIYDYYNRQDFINSDPIVYPKKMKGNTEYISFIASLFAYGRVMSIQGFLNKFFLHYGTDPFEIKNLETSLYYRFQSSGDVQILMLLVKNIYDNHFSIQNFFRQFSGNLENALKEFVDYARSFGESCKAGKGYFFLFPKYGDSGLKRLRMFLRWMVRKDEIDLGLWKYYKTEELYYPLDTHILRFAKNWNIVGSETNSHRNTCLITNYFKNINKLDPVKYDFAITRLGMLNLCKFIISKNCRLCELKDDCLFN